MASNNRGKTALITGASGGIGEELAKVFAARGFDLVLVARTEAKLQALGEVLAAQHGIRATPLAADLARAEAPAEVATALADRGIVADVLVNNAGFTAYGNFADLDLDEQLRMIRVNIAALTELTHRLLPGMIERRWGRVLNLGSTAAFMPGPLMAVYYATKAYVLSFSEALNSELAGTGVTVTALCPGPTSSGFQARGGMEDSKLIRGREIMGAEEVALVGYEALMRGQTVAVPGRMNWATSLMPRFLPRRVVPGIVLRAQGRAE